MGCRPGLPRHREGSGGGEIGAQVVQQRWHARRSLPAAGPQPAAARRSVSIPLLTAVCSCCRAWGRSGGGSDRCSRARAGRGAGSISRCGARTHARARHPAARPHPRRTCATENAQLVESDLLCRAGGQSERQEREARIAPRRIHGGGAWRPSQQQRRTSRRLSYGM